ncbi:MAG: AAA family ATPase [Gammaproteobacteria bacterium]|nr:AAA family ATPase [Gammaproteobacteria bacterium]MDE0283711.1 AAA family ATPase [Gammaproteobacteria bacterium]MDE0512494.1 AAA family ATPase [Gammaproteobacteria bacterium]
MLSRLRICNFRAFKSLDVEKLGKMNLFSGRNNSGKTSLLEAIFLLSGAKSPTTLLNANFLRGVTVISDSKHVPQDALWKPVFHNLDMSSPIEITGHHFSCKDLTIKLAVERPNLFELPLAGSDAALGETHNEGELIRIDYLENDKLKTGHTITLAGGVIRVKEGTYDTTEPAEAPYTATILSPRNGTMHKDAERLGQLRLQKKGDLVVKALRVIEPRLVSVEVSYAAGIPTIWGDVGLDELVPISVMGDGMIQLARIILAISSTPGGVVLLDEVENGLHHSVLLQTWQVIQKAADQFDTQIFATTHSYECISAAGKVFEESGDDVFLLHRLETTETGTRCVTYNKETMEAAIQHNMEVR